MINKYLEKIAALNKPIKKQVFNNIILSDTELPTLVTRNRKEQAAYLASTVRPQINKARAKRREDHEAWVRRMKDYW